MSTENKTAYKSRQNKYSKVNNKQTFKKSSASAAKGSSGKKSSKNSSINKPSNLKRANGKKPYKKQGKVQNKPSVKIAFLGGLNEIGKNITLIECENDIVIVDCGMAFPDGDMLGVDLVIPDFSYIEQNFEKIRGIVLTHGAQPSASFTAQCSKCRRQHKAWLYGYKVHSCKPFNSRRCCICNTHTCRHYYAHR